MPKMIMQFTIPDSDGVTSQELFEVTNWEWLYDRFLTKPIELWQKRFVFVIRRHNKKRNVWRVIDIVFYKRRHAAVKRFEKNKDHILRMRGYSK